MKQIKFVPKECEGPEAKYSGHILLRVPNFDEKWGMLEEMGLELDADGGVKADGAKGVGFIRKSVRAAKPFFAEVQIKGPNGEYKSYDDLSDDGDTHSILMGASMAVVTGMKLGNG